MSDEPRGVLERQAGERRFTLWRQPASPDLTELVEHHWSVRWDVPEPGGYRQHVLTHPSVHIAIEPDRAEVVGVVTGRFTRLLERRGRVFGVKFRPAGFHPLLGSRVAALTNRKVPVHEVFGHAGDDLAERINALDDEDRMAAAAEDFVRARSEPPDPLVPEINAIVARMMAEREIARVADVVSRTGIGERRLQRLFAEYVGASPKWVIRRYRLHEAAERLAAAEDVDLAALALDLGYFDQAHFARDFRAIVGRPPASYARSAAAAARP